MIRLLEHVRTRPRMAIATVIGVVVAFGTPGVDHAVTRTLIGWNTSVWLFLALVGLMMSQSDHERLRRNAIAQAEGAATVLALVVIAAAFSIVAIVVELSAVKLPGSRHAVPHVLFALVTVAGSWLLVPTLFALNYASIYHVTPGDDGGLKFPNQGQGFEPDYSDFLYFSFTIAVASQTADVSITHRSMRRLVLLQSVLSFVFNTTILAFTVNIAASLF